MSKNQPSQETLRGLFYSPLASRPADDATGQPAHSQEPALPRKRMGTSFDYYSIIDDAKKEAKKLGEEAAHELEKASAKAQSATGTIALYSPKYYAACTFGGTLACVSCYR